MTPVVWLLAMGGATILGLIIAARWLEARSWRMSLEPYRLSIPSGLTADAVAAWLGHIAASTHAPRFGLLTSPPVALEVFARRDAIQHVLLVPHRLRGAVLAGLRAAMPEVRYESWPDYWKSRPHVRLAAEARLSSVSRPLAHDRAEQASAALLSSLSLVGEREAIILQWIMTGGTHATSAPAHHPVAQIAATLRGTSPRTHDAQEQQALRRKQAHLLLQVAVRVGVQAPTRARATTLFGWAWGCLRGLNAAGVKMLRRALPERVVAARIARITVPLVLWPLILNTHELAGLVGFPLGDLALPGLPRRSARQLPPPAALATTGSVVALSTYPGVDGRPLALKTGDRLRHSWVIGPTGVGKSTLLAGQIVQDIKAGRGVLVIDPKGRDLINDVLARMPDERMGDVVVLDPSATDRPIGLSLLDIGRGEHAEELAVDNLVHLMASLWQGSWGPRTSDVIRNALLTLTHTRAADGSRFTLVELPELLLNPAFRRFVVRQPSVPPYVKPFWNTFEEMSDGERAQVIGPSLNKLRSFTTRTALRLMLGQTEGLRLDEVFTHRRIVLVPLPAGIIGRETAALVGSLVVSALWMATLARATVPAEHRHPVFVYLDEFQSILRLPVDLTDMLAQARGLGVGLTLAHQYLGQLTEGVRTAVLGTARTQICFQTEYEDAQVLSKRFAPLTALDLLGLPAYEIAMRPCVDGGTLAPVTGRTLPLEEPTTDAEALARTARMRRGRDRAEVEAAICARSTPPPRTRTGRQDTGGHA